MIGLRLVTMIPSRTLPGDVTPSPRCACQQWITAVVRDWSVDPELLLRRQKAEGPYPLIGYPWHDLRERIEF